MDVAATTGPGPTGPTGGRLRTTRGRRARARAVMALAGVALAAVVVGSVPAPVVVARPAPVAGAHAAPVATPASPPVDEVAGPSAERAWVTAAYRDLLDRAPTAAQLDHRAGQLAAGRPRRQVADELVASREHAGVLVGRLYQRILGRTVDGPSRTYWSDRLQAGERDSTVASFLYGSPERFEAAGSTAEGYVTFLYRDVLGREPDPAGLAYWTTRIEAGESRTGLARAWYLTPEATGLRAGLAFLDLLRRPPTAAERLDWAGRLRRHDLRRIEAALVSTAGYWSVAGDPAPSTRLTGGNDASRSPSLSADGRIVAFVSRASDLTPTGSPPGADVFVFDRRTGRMRALTAGNGASSAPQVSADGTAVVFQSAATNLVAGDDNGKVDVFRASTAGGPVERLTDGDGDSTNPHPDADGSVVSFTSAATDLVEDDPNGAVLDAYVRTDGAPATIERIGTDSPTYAGNLTDDGSTVALSAVGLEQGGPEPEGYPVAYLARLPRGEELELVRVSVLANGPLVSGDGRRVLYVDLSSGPPFARIVVASVDAAGEVTARETVGGGRLGTRELSPDGAAAMFSYVDDQGFHTVVLAVGDDPDPVYPALPEDSDLGRGGRIVVGALDGQLRLYEAR